VPPGKPPSHDNRRAPSSAPLDILADIAADLLAQDDSNAWPPLVVDGLLKIKAIAAVTILPNSAALDILAYIAADMLDRDDPNAWPPLVVDGLLKIKAIAAVTIWWRPEIDEPIVSVSSGGLKNESILSMSRDLAETALETIGDEMVTTPPGPEPLIAIRLDHDTVLTFSGISSSKSEMLELGRQTVRMLRAPIAAIGRGMELRTVSQDLAHHRDLERRIAEALSGVKDIASLGMTVQSLVETRFKIEYAAIYFLESGTRHLRLVGNKGLNEWEVEDAERTAWDRHPGRVIRTGEMVHVHDTKNDPEQRSLTSARRVEIRSRCYLPVHAGGEIVGALGLASTRVGAFDERHVDVLKFLGDLAGLTWIRLQEEVQRQTRDRVLVASGDAADLLLASPRWRDSILRVLGLIEDAFRSYSARFIGIDGRSFGGPSNMPDVSKDFLLATATSETGGLVGDGEEPVPGFDSDAPGISTSFVAVPIWVQGETGGILLIEESSRSRIHDQSSIVALRAFADLIGATMAREAVEGELVHAQRMEAVGLLAGGIAHDFNNLLWPILVHSSTLADSETDEPRLEMLSDIQLAARRAAELVEQILFLSRRRVIADSSTPLKDVIEEAMVLLAPSTPDHIRLESEINDPNATTRGDRTALLRVVQNLVTNARHAIEGTSGTVTVVLRRCPVNANIIYLEVRDDGVGIPEEIRKNLFDPYFSTRAVGRGTGLGLTIVHRVITEIGGEIEVESEEGKGTTFRVSLPRSEEAELLTIPSKPKISPRGDERVLVVDDDPMVLQTSASLVESLGYDVNAADGTETALAIFDDAREQGTEPRLVLTDLSMPDRDGISLTESLRDRGFTGPIVLLTGFGDDSVERAAKAGVTEILQKPIPREDLGIAIRRLLDRPKGP
jgi:signal transduction histidine kinase/ActR/RegA family two-component response regulator/putative methionine-R-sulfoxide reductase with GAF domain